MAVMRAGHWPKVSLMQHTAGDTLSITVARDGQMQTVNVTLGEKTASNS